MGLCFRFVPVRRKLLVRIVALCHCVNEFNSLFFYWACYCFAVPNQASWVLEFYPSLNFQSFLWCHAFVWFPFCHYLHPSGISSRSTTLSTSRGTRRRIKFITLAGTTETGIIRTRYVLCFLWLFYIRDSTLSYLYSTPVDFPRFFVPAWGPVPQPAFSQSATNGYDFTNNQNGDQYIFLLGSTLPEWHASRAEFVRLAGPTPLLPDIAYGTWFTWYLWKSEYLF